MTPVVPVFDAAAALCVAGGSLDLRLVGAGSLVRRLSRAGRYRQQQSAPDGKSGPAPALSDFDTCVHEALFAAPVTLRFPARARPGIFLAGTK